MNVVYSNGSIGWFHGKTKEWTTSTGTVDGIGYRKLKMGGDSILVHRLVAMAFLDNFSNELDVDHINGVRSDNRVSNLRMVTHVQNMQGHRNPRKGVSSKYRGVSWNKEREKWRAYITVNGSRKSLGSFDDEVKAAQAFNAASTKFGFQKESLNLFN